MIGTAFSVLIRLELSAPGVQFLSADHQLFNVIISAHALIMIFLCDSVPMLSLYSSQILEFTLYSIKRMTYLDPKGYGDHSMSLYYLESKSLMTRRGRALNYPWLNLNWLNSKSRSDCITDILRDIEYILRSLNVRRIQIVSVIVETMLSIGQYLLIEWKPKDNRRLNIGTGSLPKGINTYGRGRPIVPALLFFKLSKLGYAYNTKREYRSLITIKREVVRFYSSETTNSLSLAKYPGLLALSELRLEFQQHQQVKNVYNLLLNEDLFITAFKKISSNKGAMTKGINSETLDGYSMKIIRDTILQLKNHSFQFKPSRREYIPKANGKLRPLGIPSPRDKIVQQIMVMILEAIFENSVFLECSHGFRPNKGCHTALKSISR